MEEEECGFYVLRGVVMVETSSILEEEELGS